MAGHKPSSNSFAYKVLGGDLTTEIRFELPGLRFEHIRVGRREVLGFTAVTPKEDETTLVTQVFYWTVPWLRAITVERRACSLASARTASSSVRRPPVTRRISRSIHHMIRGALLLSAAG